MQGNIDEIIKIRNCTGRMRIVCDGGEVLLAADVSTCRELKLAVGGIIDDALMQKLHKAEYDSALCRTLAYLAAGSRSVKQINDFLIRKEYAPEIIGRVLEFALSRAMLDDAALAARLVELKGKVKGRHAVEQELYRRGIDREQVKEAVETISPDDEKAALARMLPKLLKRYETREPYEKKRLVAQALYRRGFSQSIIMDVLDAASDFMPEL